MTHAIKRTALVNRLAARLRGFKAFLADRSGMSFILTALSLPVVLGMAGLGFDATIWYMEKRQNQTVADNAALTATMELNRDTSKTPSQLLATVEEDAERNGYDIGATRKIVVNNPPLSGPNTGDPLFVEVIATEQRNLYLSSFVYNGPITVTARAVGGIKYIGEHCIIALDETMDKAIELTAAANATISCGVASNSNSAMAIAVEGNATLDAEPLQAFGDIYESGSATVTSEYPPAPLSERVEDPYAYVEADNLIPPVSGACKSTDLPHTYGAVDNPHTLVSNHPMGDINAYCGGIRIQAGADVTMEPGVYVIDDGDFWVSGTATVRGVGVTIILTAFEPGKKLNLVGNFIINGGANVDLSAPTVGDYAGLLFIQDPNAPAEYVGGIMEQNLLTGGADMNLTGAIYTPTREVVLVGNSDASAGGATCTQIIAAKITISGAAFIDNDPAACAAAGITAMLETRVRLFE